MRIVFAGCRNAGYECLKYLIEQGEEIVAVLTSYDLDENPRWSKSVGELANKHKLPIITEYEGLKYEHKLKGDVLFSVYYHKKFSKDFLSNFKMAINFHGGKLPEYKGAFSNIYSILHNEKTTASTAHFMETELDGGDIIDEEEVPIDENEIGSSLYFKISDATIIVFKRIYERLKTNGILSHKPIGESHTYKRILPNNGNIDWSKSAKEVCTFIRALNFRPLQPAKSYLKGEEYHFYTAKIVDFDYEAEPGQFCEGTEKGEIVIKTGKGCIYAENIEKKGETGFSLTLGDKFE